MVGLMAKRMKQGKVKIEKTENPTTQYFGLNCVQKYAYATKKGSQGNIPKIENQTRIILAPKVQNLKSVHLFGLCDGHGKHG